MADLYKYGVAVHLYKPIIKRAVVDFAVGADWTPVAGDVKISKDGGAAANVTNLPSAITMGNTAMWDYSLTATELQAAKIRIMVSDAATKAVEDTMFEIDTYGNASAQHAVDLNDSVRAGLTALPNAAPGAAGALLIAGVNAPVTISGAGTALTLTSTSGNGHGLSATGQGTGNGIAASGGVTNASGVKCVGQGSGSGFEADASGAGGHGALVQGNGVGAGLFAVGGVDGDGIDGIGGAGGAVATHGVKGLSQSLNGCGLRGVGGPTGAGIGGLGGPTSGAGIRGAAQAGNSPGVEGTGFGTSSGIKGTGGDTGVGVEAVGGATSGAGMTATAVGGNSDGFTCTKVGTGVDIRGNQTGSVSSVTGNVGGNVLGSVASVVGNIGGSVASIVNAGIDLIFDRAAGIETGFTLRQALRLILSSAAGKLSGAATATATIRDINDTKNRITATVDADGNRTAVTTDVT